MVEFDEQKLIEKIKKAFRNEFRYNRFSIPDDFSLSYIRYKEEEHIFQGILDEESFDTIFDENSKDGSFIEIEEIIKTKTTFYFDSNLNFVEIDIE